MRREQIRPTGEAVAARRRAERLAATTEPLRFSPPPARSDDADDLLERIDALLGGTGAS